MSRRGWISAGALIAVLLGIVATWWWALSDDEAPADDGLADEASEEELDEWVFDEPRRPRAPTREQAREGERRGPPDRDSPEWAERRRRWRERWRRRVEIVPLGERATEIDADAIREALRPRRPALRACIGEAGGWQAFREARRAQREPSREEGRRRRRGRVFFDVRPDGRVDRETLRLEPPMPEPFSECFLGFFGSLELENAGDGARVELPLGPGRGRRRFGDGGMPGSDRWRGRGGDRPPRGGPRRERERGAPGEGHGEGERGSPEPE